MEGARVGRRAAARIPAILLVAVLAATLVASCSAGTGTSGQRKRASVVSGGRNSAKPEVKRPESERIQKSAGARIYGEPERIDVIIDGKKRVLRPGDEHYDELRNAGERVMLRASGRNGEPPASEEMVDRLIEYFPCVVQFTYKRSPEFTYFEDSSHRYSRGMPDLSDLDGKPQITFVIPREHDEIQPYTWYDGFRYNTVGIISTLTNYELFEVVWKLDKELNSKGAAEQETP